MKNFSFILTFILLAIQVSAQDKKFERSKDVGLIVGTSYYLGEINPYKHFGTRLKAGGGLHYRNNFDRRWSVKGSLLYGQVEAWDQDSDDAYQRNRNLSFRNQIIEGSMQFELNFFPYQLSNPDYPVSPYLFGGIGFFNMKPMANYRGTWYELQPLGTEGQGLPGGQKPYKTNLLCVPFGAGIKVNIISVLALNLEWGVRKTWTDYFDDVSGNYVDRAILAETSGPLAAALSDRSIVKETNGGSSIPGLQRGDPGRKDFYFFAQAAIVFRIDKKANSCWK
ncbi:MAG TPA: DUF6089 family protein [Flavobacteriales bacterium]